MTTIGYTLNTPFTLTDDLVPKSRADLDCVPSKDNELYYEQRTGAGLIITEATAISEQGYNWYRAAGLYATEYAGSWKRVIDCVHAKGGTTSLQMWCMDRQSHSSFNAKRDVVSVSAIPVVTCHSRDVDYVRVPYETPHALKTDEAAGVVDDYHKCVQLAKDAGFDGIEIHTANGNLIDVFLQSASNTRTDKYGGSVENCARFLLEVVGAVKTVWAANRIGVRLSLNRSFANMGSEDNVEQFLYAMEKLSHHGLVYLAMLDSEDFGFTTSAES